MKRSILLFVITLLLSACADVNIKDTDQVENNHGVALVKFDSDFEGWYLISIVNKDNYLAGSAYLRIYNSDSLKVISLPAGAYIWKAFYSTSGYAEFKKEFGFTIEADRINYIGDISSSIDFSEGHYNFTFENNPKTIEAFKELYPVLSNNVKIVENITSISH